MGRVLETSDEQRVFDSVAGAIGSTPLVRLNRVASTAHCAVYAKLEMLNPGGSVKDRIAFGIIDAHEAAGELEPGGTVVEATSGNTGVGLAIACVLRGYRAIFVMPDKMSQEKIDLLRAYGARVVITPTAVAPDDPRSYYSVARRLVEETPGAVLANQYHNPANPASHEQSTGPEIWAQTGGQVTDIVMGMGTGGTITGVARYMRDQKAGVRIVGVDPIGSILYDAWRRGGEEEGLEAIEYLVEGIGEDFIPSTLDLSLVDEVVQVSDAESFAWTRRLVREEGIFAGGSSGSALAGAMKYAQGLGPDRLVVVLLPDSGSRYLSKVFDDHWMRDHGFILRGSEPTVLEVAQTRGLPELVTAGAENRPAEVIAKMRQYAISQLPVVDGQGRLIGVVTEVDLLHGLLSSGHAQAERLTIESLINRDVPAVEEDTPFQTILGKLSEHKVIVLVDGDNRPRGILTMIDALEYVSARGEA
jgi:cystathionine beta-synthase